MITRNMTKRVTFTTENKLITHKSEGEKREEKNKQRKKNEN